MKAFIELSNFAVGTVSSKRTTPSETEGEVEVSPKNFLAKIFIVPLSQVGVGLHFCLKDLGSPGLSSASKLRLNF